MARAPLYIQSQGISGFLRGFQPPTFDRNGYYIIPMAEEAPCVFQTCIFVDTLLRQRKGVPRSALQSVKVNFLHSNLSPRLALCTVIELKCPYTVMRSDIVFLNVDYNKLVHLRACAAYASTATFSFTWWIQEASYTETCHFSVWQALGSASEVSVRLAKFICSYTYR